MKSRPSFNKRIVTFVAGDILAKSRAFRSAAKAKEPLTASKDKTTRLPFLATKIYKETKRHTTGVVSHVALCRYVFLDIFFSFFRSYSCNPPGKERWIVSSTTSESRLTQDGGKWIAPSEPHRNVCLACHVLDRHMIRYPAATSLAFIRETFFTVSRLYTWMWLVVLILNFIYKIWM